MVFSIFLNAITLNHKVAGWNYINNIRSTYKAQTASLNYALSRNRGNEYSWKAELNVNYTKQDDEYLMPNSVQNAENLSLGLGGKKFCFRQ